MSIISFLHSSTESIIKHLNDLLLLPIFGAPFILLWLALAAILLTLKLNFINFTMIGHALKVVISKKEAEMKDDQSNIIQISPLTAFLSQAAGNLGIGNISGAAFAVSFGGPGVIVWILISIFFFSIIKFCEITLGHLYRHVEENGNVSGGAYYFLNKGLQKVNGCKKLAKPLALIVGVITFLLPMSWSGFQMNQIVKILSGGQEILNSQNNINYTVLTISLAIILLAFVILKGGIKSLGRVAHAVVPFMATLYIILCTTVILKSHNNILPAISIIINRAFMPEAITGGLSYVIVVAMQRMMFASESGIGTAAIIHATANVKYSAQQGLIALIDCILIAFIISYGAFTLVVSGIDVNNPDISGIMLIGSMFKSLHPWAIYALSLIAFLFGFTTITSNGYYVQKACGYLFGTKREAGYLYFYIAVVTGMSFYQPHIFIRLIDVAGMLIMIPNIIGIVLLSNQVKEQIDIYKQSLLPQNSATLTQ